MAALGMERRGHGTAPVPSTPGSHGQGALPALGMTFRQGSDAGPAGTAPQLLPSLWFSNLEKPQRSQTPPAALLWADTSRRHPGKGKHPEKHPGGQQAHPAPCCPPFSLAAQPQPLLPRWLPALPSFFWSSSAFPSQVFSAPSTKE